MLEGLSRKAAASLAADSGGPAEHAHTPYGTVVHNGLASVDDFDAQLRVVTATVPAGSASYAAAGVDIEAGDRGRRADQEPGRPGRPARGGRRARRVRRAVPPRHRAVPRPAAGLARTDGVGTKLAIAQAMDKHDTVGIDLVGMVVDDLVVCGAEPLFMQDYVAVGRVVPERVAEIVGGHRRRLRARRLRAGRRRDRRAPRA